MLRQPGTLFSDLPRDLRQCANISPPKGGGMRSAQLDWLHRAPTAPTCANIAPTVGATDLVRSQPSFFDHFEDTAGVRVLVACEFTGTVRDAFSARGYDAWSCDLLPSPDRHNRHIQGDVRDVLGDGWDLLMVAHPPCTRLCNSGVRWLSEPPGKLEAEHYSAEEVAAYAAMDRDARLAFMWDKLDEGAELFSVLWNAPIARIAVENPVMHGHAKRRIRGYREPAQSVQPWQFGEWETKRTCLWLKGLPALQPTYRTLDDARAGLGLAADAKPANRVHAATPGPDRWAERSRFFPTIAAAMAEQWAAAINPAPLPLAA